ncbi:Xylulose kinase [bacterium HR17]|uniref:Xylulose kinase n=1 Tax=Candidatus Fervidibacter japonicus TaxID=2035412 RepID=A0A2H5XFP9_9BACT|nr:Xylulose kinase [bacterium HR17]
MQPPFVLSVDIGTSSLRALVFDAQGQMLPDIGVQVSYEPQTTPDGGAFLDADELLHQTVQAINGVVAQLGANAARIAAVATCTVWHSVLGVDKSGNAITPFLLWADSRCVNEADELKRQMDEHAYHARTGCFLHTNFLPAKLLWFRRHFPDIARRVHCWLSFGEYLHRRLLGTTACSISMASGTGLFNHAAADWDDETLRAIGILRDCLAPLVNFEPLAIARPAPFVPRPLLAAAWFPALGDGACSNIGSGAITPDVAALMVGTTAVMRVMTTDANAQPPFGLWHYRADLQRHLIGGAQSNGGVVFQWLAETLHLPGDWETQLAAMSPDEHGLTILPFLLGERAPEWDASVPSAIVGVRLHHTPLHLLRAFMEAVALRMALIHALVKQAVPRMRHIIATGGALVRSRLWTQMFADALGQPITLCLEPEASARGAALMALEALGIVGNLTDVPVRWGETVDPDPRRHERYRAALYRQRRLYALAKQWLTELTDEHCWDAREGT